ncbi:MAG: response regulator [Polyangiaceae bacterium]
MHGSKSASLAAAHEWRRRVVPEYNSAAITHSLLGWLLRLGASPTLLHEGVRIIEDELVHAEMAFAVVREAGDAGADVTLGGVSGLELEIAISDTGVGITRDFLPHVFQRFSQEDGSIRRSHGGLGLGFAITKHLVELHGGEIRAESAGEGQGSRFVVTLPLAADTETGASDAPHTLPIRDEQELKGLRLLLVEDDADSREVVAAILEDSGVLVTTANSAEHALSILERVPVPVDVIVSDVGLPGLDGYAFLGVVRKNPALVRIPAAALTAYAYPEDRQRALNAGFQMHLRKPFAQAELLATVSDLAKIADALKT